jgi:CDP-glucose 4,6-dehydratase
LAPPTKPSNFELSNVREVLAEHHEAEIRDGSALRAALARAQPDVVLHLAAQSLVGESYRNPRDTFEVNFMGTANLLDAIRELRIACTVIVVTSDKCYENREWTWGYRESDPMGGHDPYSASKGATELLVASYQRSFFPPESLEEHGVRLASARAGNVIGGGDWSPGHIVVDIVAALAAGKPIDVRNPYAVRPWQHIMESLSGYLTLASAMLGEDPARYCDAWNFGPALGDARPVRDLVDLFIARWGEGSWRDASDPSQPHEAGVLRLAIDKACSELAWVPRWSVEEAVEHTVEWYKRYLERPEACQEVCVAQIKAYHDSRA